MKQAVHTEYEGYLFDSASEANFYRMLRTFLPKESIKCQYNVKCGADWWACDFYIPKHQLLVEYKGFLTDSFVGKMKVLKNRNLTAWNQLILVSDQSLVHIENKIVLFPNEAIRFIKAMGEV